MRKYSAEQIEFVAANIKGRSFHDLTNMFNERFGLSLKVSTMISLADRNGLHNGRDCRILAGEMAAGIGKEYRFKPGMTPWNKGMKGLKIGGEATQFKKGQKGWNYKPVGSERINGDGYVDVKIADPGKWRQKHILIWEVANGPIPKGHCLIFADGNPLNVTLDNLLLITRADLAVMNKRGLIAKSAELTKVGITVSQIIRKATERKKNRRKKS